MEHNPYEEAIEYLRYDIGDDDPDIMSVRAAIRLLEAAGKVDKGKAWTAWHWLHSESVIMPPDVPEGSKHIQNLLAVLEDKGE